MKCKYCADNCRKAGKQQNGQQCYYCKICKKYQQEHYQYGAYKAGVMDLLPSLVCESVSIRGISRLLKMSTITVMKRVQSFADLVIKPTIPSNQLCFELDEICTYVGNKANRYWIAYALCSETRQVIDFIVGKRTKRVLRKIVQALLFSQVKIIKTDKLNIYQSLIPQTRHISNAYNINHIERNNLNVRTHLKRLNRRTICFSKSLAMLEACLKIYFWGKN